MADLPGFAPSTWTRTASREAALELIRLTPGGLARSQLASLLGISRSAVTAIVGELIERGLLQEAAGRASRGGRRAVPLQINRAAATLLGIDIGATHILIVLTDLAAHVLAEAEAPWAIGLGPEACLQRLEEMQAELLKGAPSGWKRPWAVGVGVPGPVVASRGMVSAPPIMPGWDGFPIRQRLEEQWGLPVSLHNDAELGALGEWSFGAGRGVKDMVYVKVGTGIGSGLLLNGRIYRGVSGTAGEIGHITIDQNGPRCTCGNRGCLEAMAGGLAIAEQAIAAVKRGEPTALASYPNVEKITAFDVAEAAKRGDHLAQRLLHRAGLLIGTAIATLVNLFNPSLVVIGGGVAQVGDLLLEPIRQTVEKRSLRASANEVRIQAAMLGRRSSGMGAIALAQSWALRMLAGGARTATPNQGGVPEPMPILESR
ncbi:MAG: ROK family transcriptional regulator [Chloroflexota bacterium]